MAALLCALLKVGAKARLDTGAGFCWFMAAVRVSIVSGGCSRIGWRGTVIAEAQVVLHGGGPPGSGCALPASS